MLQSQAILSLCQVYFVNNNTTDSRLSYQSFILIVCTIIIRIITCAFV
jgi:hypothetical protein